MGHLSGKIAAPRQWSERVLCKYAKFGFMFDQIVFKCQSMIIRAVPEIDVSYILEPPRDIMDCECWERRRGSRRRHLP